MHVFFGTHALLYISKAEASKCIVMSCLTPLGIPYTFVTQGESPETCLEASRMYSNGDPDIAC